MVMIAKMIDHKIYGTAFISEYYQGSDLKVGNFYKASVVRSMLQEPEDNSAQKIAKEHLNEYLENIYKYLYKFCEDNTRVSYFLLKHDEFFTR
jgi:hypothetical protein